MEIVNRQALLFWFDDQDAPLPAALVTPPGRMSLATPKIALSPSPKGPRTRFQPPLLPPTIKEGGRGRQGSRKKRFSGPPEITARPPQQSSTVNGYGDASYTLRSDRSAAKAFASLS